MTEVERDCWLRAMADCPTEHLYSMQWQGFCDG
jgi:hypothetical protein